MHRLELSRRLALFFGIVVPLAETVRRWGHLWEYPPAYLDDWILGAFLIAGAYATRKPAWAHGRALLAAAWGFACGIAYNSIATHWIVMNSGVADPAPIATEVVFAIKSAAGICFIGGLILTIRAQPEPRL